MFLLSLFSVLVSTVAFADPDPCLADRQKFCAAKTQPAEIQDCMLASEKQLTRECREATMRWLQIRKDASSRGGGSLSAFGGPGAMGPPMRLLTYEGRHSPGNQAPEFSENKVGVSLPVFKGEKDTFAMSLSSGTFHFGENLVLDNGRKLPRDLYRLELGAQNFHQLPDKKNWTLRASVGQNGDQPFKEASDTSYSVSATYGFPGSGDGYWIAMIYFSNNSPLGNFIPIPGISYMIRREGFTGIFGFPFSTLQWSFKDNLSYSVSLFGPSVQAEAAKGDPDKLQFLTGFNWQRQTFILRERDENKHRLTIEEKKIYAGARKIFASKVLGEFQFGQSFDRKAFIGDGLFNHDGGRVNVPAEWYAMLSVKVKY